jgi:hypothetical protein
MNMARKKAVEKPKELCPECEQLILERGKVDSIEEMIANETEFDGGQAVTYLKLGHKARRKSNDRVFSLRVNPHDPAKLKAFATVDENDKVKAFWTLSIEELLADDWIIVK